MFALAVGIILSTNYNDTAAAAQCLFVADVCFGVGLDVAVGLRHFMFSSSRSETLSSVGNPASKP
jgi:hypothetical protein